MRERNWEKKTEGERKRQRDGGGREEGMEWEKGKLKKISKRKQEKKENKQESKKKNCVQNYITNLWQTGRTALKTMIHNSIAFQEIRISCETEWLHECVSHYVLSILCSDAYLNPIVLIFQNYQV